VNKKTAYDLAGMPIRAAITCVNTGRGYYYNPDLPGLVENGVSFWDRVRGFFGI